MTAITGVHPHANEYPMLGADELQRLAEDIAENGLRDPVTVTPDGLILDGRNRAAACDLLGVEPDVVVYERDDLGAFVRSRNTSRRHMSTGALAMATARSMARDGLRENGRWRRGSVAISGSGNSDSQWGQRLAEAGVVLDYKPDLAPAVVAGDLALDAAFREADTIRRSAEHEKVRERELKKREREEAKAEAQRNAKIVADLTELEQDRYLALIDDGTLTPAAAWSAYMEDTRKERQREAEIDRGRRDTVTHVAESLRYLSGGAEYAAIYRRDFQPHEARFLAEPMRPTRARIDSAIQFLQHIREGVQQ